LVSVLSGEDFGIPEAAEKGAKLIALFTAKLITQSLFLLCRKQVIRLLRRGRGMERSRQ
jgi:hypothetical protein